MIGLLMGYELLSAVVLKAGFIGVMLFSLKRAGARLHLLATAMIEVGMLMAVLPLACSVVLPALDAQLIVVPLALGGPGGAGLIAAQSVA